MSVGQPRKRPLNPPRPTTSRSIDRASGPAPATRPALRCCSSTPTSTSARMTAPGGLSPSKTRSASPGTTSRPSSTPRPAPGAALPTSAPAPRQIFSLNDLLGGVLSYQVWDAC